MKTMAEFVVEQLGRWKGHWPIVARESGVPIRTIQKVASQNTRNPTARTVQNLHDFFRRFEGQKRKVTNGRSAKQRHR